MLARNAEVDREIRSLTSLENRFYKGLHYPIVFLNNKAWDEDLIDGVQRVAIIVTESGVVGEDSCGYSRSINQVKARTKI
ncbi:MAG: hypothetical protein ALECFALPRED_004693 [Alectoria fallacina]|uniref:Uncharacterized protein n=1 Tax=Alectoria fallacina TaxID=1903189 RepID=A0A8H3EQX7_9LECA|nr:MAG: hypothetical protein ALECFALPRED_004693 [Alectoria fallacina]